MTDMDACNQFVTLRLAGQLIGLPIAQVHDVFQIGPLTPIPLTDDSVLGLMNLRGRIILVYALDGLIGLPAPSHRPLKLAVGVSWRGESFGIQIDDIGDVITVPVADSAPVPSHIDRTWARHARRIHKLADELMIELDLPSLLDAPRAQAA